MRAVSIALVFASIAFACGGSHESDLFGPAGAPAAASNPEAPAPSGESAPPSGGGDAGKTDAAKPDASTPAPAPPKNPLDGAGDLMTVTSGYGSLEGPVWRASSKSLLFSDLQTNSIERFAPPSSFNTYRFPSGGSNGLALDAQGQLVVCEGKNRRVTRTLANGTSEVVADQYQGLYFNAPNDVTVRSDGTIYFTDPDYSVYGLKELEFNGVFRVSTDGAVSLVADDLSKPNGIALSPDEKILYVTDEKVGFIRAYDVASDGTTANARKFAEAPHADGIAVDDDGNLFVAAQDGVRIFKPDGGAWGTIAVPKQPANIAFGGSNRRTLFVTASDTLYSMEMVIPGPG